MSELMSLTENKPRIEQKGTDDYSLNALKKVASRDTYIVLSPKQLERLKQISEAIFKLANETLLEIIKQDEVESWMESRYGVVKSLWKNGQTGINLARFDFAWDQEKNFKILEMNTGSSAGWLFSGLICKEASAEKIGVPLAPPTMFLAVYLLNKLGSKIAVIIKDSFLERDFFISQIESMGGEAKVFSIIEANFQDIVDYAPTGIYWKCVGAVEHSDIILKLSNLKLPQIPSFESMFISGDKSFLAILSDRDITGAIPKTYVLSKNDISKNLNFFEQHKAVLKAGDSSRGREVILGKNYKNSWEDKLREIMNSNKEWIIQELCYLQNTKDNRYEDIAVFIVDGVVQGFGSRISSDEILNASKVGFGQSVVLKYDN
ncbi:6242_t:CDS:1 [Dentiscutata heterogama]|uniref:6242_t:CDS:1 n=1 Tax=Dentiscutata heterogama TaxID=1316150 RepID=A0ACA9KD36_9GLOM|nr:6242_t:CDS:1 [Dentiscutata heterogama]